MKRRKKADVIKTIFSSLHLVILSGAGKYLLITSIWLFMGAFTSFTAVFQKNFVNAGAKILDGNSSAFRIAILWLAIWGIVELLMTLTNILVNRFNNHLWNQVEYYIQDEISKKASRVKLSYFDNTDTHRILDFVKTNLGMRISYIIGQAFQILFSLVQFLTVGVIIGRENLWIAVIIIGSAIPSVIIQNLQTEESYWDEQYNSHEARFQDYVSWLLIWKKYVREMQFYNLYDYVNKRFDQSVEVLQSVRIKTMKKYSFINVFASLLNYASIGFALVLIVLDIYHGRVGVGSFVLVYSSAQNLQDAVKSMFSSMMNIGSEGRYIEDYFTVQGYEEETDEKEQKEEKTIDNTNLDIEFRNVSFVYPETDRVVLKNINLKIRHGEKIAIIGENGSGKSTFIALLTGLYEPVEGQILVNGEDISKNLTTLRHNLSCTYQNFVQYQLSIRENILLGDLQHPHDDDDVKEAAKKAGIYDEIMEMPDGFDTPLGNYAENGRDLSGGQWQKLAMARNLIKTTASIMILDEPTAALDPVAESELYQQFQSMTGDKTVLLISHRLGITKLAQRVLVFQEGQIVEDGSHEELVRKNGVYAQMYHAQSRWYV